MSWDSYPKNLTDSGHIDQAAICGLDGSSWASTPGFTVTQEEVLRIVSGFSNQAMLSSGGIMIGGEKYFFLQSDDSQVQGKKGAGGLSIAKSKTCVLVGVYKDGKQPGNARKAVEALKDYLISTGY